MRILQILIMLMPLSCFATERATELQLAEQYFGPHGIENKAEVYIGEMLEQQVDQATIGETLPEGIKVQVRELDSDEQRKIYAVLLSKDDQTQDWYVYFQPDQGIWKIAAVRQLKFHRLFDMAMHELEHKSHKTTEEQQLYENMLLTEKRDADLKAYLQDHQQTLETIASVAKEQPEKATKLAKDLNLNSASYQTDSGITDVKIGGVLSSVVGYYHVPTGAAVPAMSANDLIYIEPVVGNWYLYKDTKL